MRVQIVHVRAQSGHQDARAEVVLDKGDGHGTGDTPDEAALQAIDETVDALEMLRIPYVNGVSVRSHRALLVDAVTLARRMDAAGLHFAVTVNVPRAMDDDVVSALVALGGESSRVPFSGGSYYDKAELLIDKHGLSRISVLGPTRDKDVGPAPDESDALEQASNEAMALGADGVDPAQAATLYGAPEENAGPGGGDEAIGDEAF